jgi:hypothetical protein
VIIWGTGGRLREAAPQRAVSGLGPDVLKVPSPTRAIVRFAHPSAQAQTRAYCARAAYGRPGWRLGHLTTVCREVP